MVPKKLQRAVLDMLHESHSSITRMKTLVHGYVWWPGLDVTDLVKQCSSCQQVQQAPAVGVWPDKPGDRVHVVFAGPFMGSMFLVIVNAHSKWPEVVPMNSTTYTQTITVLRQVFLAYGIRTDGLGQWTTVHLC